MNNFILAIFSFFIYSELIASPLPVNSMAPSVVLPSVQVNNSTPIEEIRSRMPGQSYTLLDFSSIFCLPCQEGLPDLSALAHRNKDKMQVRVLFIDSSVKRIESFIQSHRAEIQMPVAIDSKKVAKKAYGITGTPTLFLLDKNNTIIYQHEGAIDSSTYNKIESMLK